MLDLHKMVEDKFFASDTILLVVDYKFTELNDKIVEMFPGKRRGTEWHCQMKTPHAVGAQD
eukprot:6679238-Prorocentrum_lima.AAC.1